jgi:hypothetical protein
VEGPHEGGEGRTKAPKAARGAATAARRPRRLHKGGEARKKATGTEAARAAHRRRGPQEGDEGRTKALKAARGAATAARGAATAARRQRGLHKGGEARKKATRADKGAEGRTWGGNGRTEAAMAAQRWRGPQEGDEECWVRVRTDRLVGSATGPLGKALIR